MIVIENGVVVKHFSIPNEMTESVLVLSQNYLLDFDNLMNLSNFEVWFKMVYKFQNLMGFSNFKV